MKRSDDSSMNRLRQQWQRFDARERRLLALAAAVVTLALLWWVGLAPPLRMLRQADQQRAALQAQTRQMRQLGREAEALKSMPRITQTEALRALETAVQQRLGASARLTVAGERATVTLKDAPAAGLAHWLTDARVNARSTPIEARLTRGSASSSGASDLAVTWNGTLSLGLPKP
jgi:general secretion pathway protein M